MYSCVPTRHAIFSTRNSSFEGSFFRCSKVSSSFPSHPNVERRSPCVLLFSFNFEQVLLVLRVA